MRGKAVNVRKGILRNRITPAYAGKRYKKPYMPDLTRDHPRLCGEKRMICQQLGWWSGITPAYAGKSLSDHS